MASPHTAKATLELLKKHFGSRIVSNKSEFIWPPNSPGMNLCDFYAWGHLKDSVFKEKPKTLSELKIKITENISKISNETLEKNINNLIVRLKCCILKKGRHFASIVKGSKKVFQ